jgi:hypothetical protein
VLTYNGVFIIKHGIKITASSNIIKVIKSRRMRWEGQVTFMGEVRNAYDVLVGKYEGKETTLKT